MPAIGVRVKAHPASARAIGRRQGFGTGKRNAWPAVKNRRAEKIRICGFFPHGHRGCCAAATRVGNLVAPLCRHEANYLHRIQWCPGKTALFHSTPESQASTFRLAVAENQPLRHKRAKQNRMISIRSFAPFTSRLREFISRCSADEDQFDHLASALFALQFARVEPYRRLCETRGVTPVKIRHWTEIPPVPAAAFKEFELSSLAVAGRTTVFHSSGTTDQRPSRHFHNAQSLAIYQASLAPWFKAHLLPDAEEFAFVILTPSPDLAPHSSLAHMLQTARREFGSPSSLFVGNVETDGAWRLDYEATLAALHRATQAKRPVVLLGTAFSFVHLLDHLVADNLFLALPPGSRVMETGGYKGRSRALPKAELHALITRHFNVPASHIVCEYGMSELSSQAYDRVAGHHASGLNVSTLQRTFHFPPWARVKTVSPETGQQVCEGESGLIQVYDLANVWSVAAIQTEDLGIRRGDGFELLGRAAPAEPRGCSLMNF